MNTFAAKFVHTSTGAGVGIIERDPFNHVVRVHERPRYSMTDAAHTAKWLTERGKGYPRPIALDHLYNGRG